MITSVAKDLTRPLQSMSVDCILRFLTLYNEKVFRNDLHERMIA